METITEIWLRDPGLGGAVAHLPWVVDGVHVHEWSTLVALGAIAEPDRETALLMLRLPWVADGIGFPELETLTIVGEFAERDPRLGRLVVDLAWLADDVTRNEYNRQISVLDAMAESDPETALLVLRLPWVADDVTDSELRMLSSVGKFAEQDPRLGRLVADLPWFAKGLDDHDSRQLLESIAERNPELAVLVAGYGWFVDGVGDYGEADSAEIFALEALSDIAARGPELARAVSELAWIADGIIYFEESALRYLGSMAEKDLELAVEAAGAPWVKDGIVRHEVFALDGLVEMVDRNPEFARQVLDFSVEAPVSDRDVYLILSLHSLQTEQLDRLIGQPLGMRDFTSTLVSMNMAGLNPLLVEVLTSEAQTFRPHRGGVDGPRLVEREPGYGLRVRSPEQQHLAIHIDLRRLPAGDAPGKGVAVAIAASLISPPGPVQPCGLRQLESDDCLDLVEGGPPLLHLKTAQIGVQSLVLAPEHHFSVLVLLVYGHVVPPSSQLALTGG